LLKGIGSINFTKKWMENKLQKKNPIIIISEEINMTNEQQQHFAFKYSRSFGPRK
jgi:hypothetical protein